MPCVNTPRVQCPECETGVLKAQVFYNEDYDSYSAYCFIHAKLITDPYSKGERPKVVIKTPEELLADIQEIKELPLAPTAFRGIPASIFRKWGVRQAVSEFDGKTPYAMYFGYTKDSNLVGWKAALMSKKSMWSVGNTKGADPFGWERALKVGGKRIYITEGEYDTIALDYALTLVHAKTKFKDRKYAIISLPGGVDTVARVMKLISEKGLWSEIVLAFDADGPGKGAVKEAQKLNPEVLVAPMPPGCKDANDAIQNKLIKELVSNCLWNVRKPPIKGVIQVSDVIDRAKELPVMGLSYPHAELTEMVYGQRFGEACAIGAGVGLGKTLLAHEWAAHNMMVHDVPCFAILLEEGNVDTLRNIAGKIDSIPYHKPGQEFDMDQYMSTVESLDRKLYMWQDNGDQHLRFDMEEIMKAIRYNVAEYGTRFIYIDNMTRLVDHLSASDANEFINRYSSEIENLATQLDIHIDVFSHLNAPYRATAHEDGGTVRLYQFTGSKGLMRSFPVMMGFERNKSAETKADQSKSIINVLKNRKYGGEGLIKTQYYPDTGRLLTNSWMDGDFLESNKKKGKH